MTAPSRVSLDQFHWVGLAQVVKHSSGDRTYREILDLGTALRAADRVRFPLSTDRYHETWCAHAPRRRIDLAYAMAGLSRYETMLQHDTLTLIEIDAALADLFGVAPPSAAVPVFGHGVNHAFGMVGLANGLHIEGPIDEHMSSDEIEYLTGSMRAVAAELLQGEFEWVALSGDPRRKDDGQLTPSPYLAWREAFAREEARRLEVIHTSGADPKAAALLYAVDLHLPQIIERADLMGGDVRDLDLDDLAGFVERIPTVHALASLLAVQYSNPQTKWKANDYGDLRTLCQAVVYCDAVAPDKHWADAVQRSGLADRYNTEVLRDKHAVLAFVESLATADS